ncbi:coiled-coil domain-containing protein 159-like isoform X1 [Pleurodeles waltl]
MNWATQINSILTATDSNVATIKQRLNPDRSFPKEPLFEKLSVNKGYFNDSLDRPWEFCTTCADSAHSSMSLKDLAAINNQLASQAKIIASLNQTVMRLEKDREHQRQRIHSLEEEVQRLQNTARSSSDAVLERRMEDLRRELSSELRHLREQVLEIPDRGQSSVLNLIEEINESKRTIWKESESVRREIDQLKQKIRRQEEDLLQHMSASHETRRGHDQNSKMLEDLLENYKRNSMDLNRAKSESQQTQLELQHIKITISNIKDEIEKLHAKGNLRLPPTRKERSRRVKTAPSKKSTVSSSGEDDSDPELSFGDISSEEVSSPLDIGTGGRKHSFQLTSRTSSDLETGTRRDLDSDLDDYDLDGRDLSNDLERLSHGAPELSFSDL